MQNNLSRIRAIVIHRLLAFLVSQTIPFCRLEIIQHWQNSFQQRGSTRALLILWHQITGRYCIHRQVGHRPPEDWRVSSAPPPLKHRPEFLSWRDDTRTRHLLPESTLHLQCSNPQRAAVETLHGAWTMASECSPSLDQSATRADGWPGILASELSMRTTERPFSSWPAALAVAVTLWSALDMSRYKFPPAKDFKRL